MKRISKLAAAIALFLLTFAAMDQSSAACSKNQLVRAWSMSLADPLKLLLVQFTVTTAGKLIGGIFYKNIAKTKAGTVIGSLTLSVTCYVKGTLVFRYNNGTKVTIFPIGYKDGTITEGFGIEQGSSKFAALTMFPRVTLPK